MTIRPRGPSRNTRLPTRAASITFPTVLEKTWFSTRGRLALETSSSMAPPSPSTIAVRPKLRTRRASKPTGNLSCEVTRPSEN